MPSVIDWHPGQVGLANRRLVFLAPVVGLLIALPWFVPPPQPNPDYVTYSWPSAWRGGALALIASRLWLGNRASKALAGLMIIGASFLAATGRTWVYFHIAG